MDVTNFGARLKELRTAAGLTQPELAEKAGVSKGGIADLEQGRNQPSWAIVIKLAAALGTDCKAFLQPPADAVQQGSGRPSKPEAAEVSGKKENAPDAKQKRKK